MKRPHAILVIVVVTVLFYLVTFHIPGMYDRMFESFALFFPLNERFRLWQLVSTMFMHSGFVHLLLNMYALWAFGSPLEELWGVRRFVFFYFAAGIGASAIYTAINYFQFNNTYNDLVREGMTADQIADLLSTDWRNIKSFGIISAERLVEFSQLFHIPAVGASGAVYGVLVAFGMLFPNAKLALIFFPVPIAAKYFIPALIALDLFSGVTGVSIFGGGIAHFAHVGGALIGFLLMLYWKKRYGLT